MLDWFLSPSQQIPKKRLDLNLYSDKRQPEIPSKF